LQSQDAAERSVHVKSDENSQAQVLMLTFWSGIRVRFIILNSLL